jgi:hypothetical protein
MDILLFNQRLLDFYGKFGTSDKPKYRLVYSANEKEKRVIKTPNFSVFAEELPKYPQIKPPKFILEALQNVSSDELVAKESYEPLWVFGKDGDPDGEPIEPSWVAIEYLLYTLYNRSHTPYMTDEDGSLESRRAEADKLYDSLFGNETSTGDALAHKEGIIVPRNFGD